MLAMEVERKQLHEKLKEELMNADKIDWRKYMSEAERWERAKDSQFANLIYSALLSRDDCDDPEMFDRIGKAFQRQKRFDEMAVAYGRALSLAELTPAKEAEFALQVAVAFIAKGRHDEALKFVQRAYSADKTKTRSRLINDKAFDPLRLNADSKIADKIKDFTEGK